MATYIIMAVIAYLIGSVNFSVLISKRFAGFDVREKGSGNAGTTNVLRSVGIKAAVITLICDILKGVVSILIAKLLGKMVQDLDTNLLIQLAGIFVILGHTFPIFFEFKGGKGVATALGVILTTNWKIGLICLVFAVVIIAFSRMVSMGAVGATILFPILILFMDGNYFVYSVIVAVIVIFNHRENIKRILNGTENKLSFKK
jgi:glycerol-3-phosphate acyltransferase PlsY